MVTNIPVLKTWINEVTMTESVVWETAQLPEYYQISIITVIYIVKKPVDSETKKRKPFTISHILRDPAYH